MFVTLKVFKLIGPSNDGQRHGRGTYLFYNVFIYVCVFFLDYDGILVYIGFIDTKQIYGRIHAYAHDGDVQALIMQHDVNKIR
jgi:hypothetical protein